VAERVLIVDDDPLQRRRPEMMMTESGYALVVAGGDAALAILTRPGQAAADCVVLDLVMSGLDGLGALVEEPNAPRALLRLLADHGQVRPLDEIKGEVIRFAPAHSGRRLFKAARRRVIGRSTLDRKLETLEIALSAHHDASSVAVR
jgi:DNA-binding NtrC family response regulator